MTVYSPSEDTYHAVDSGLGCGPHYPKKRGDRLEEVSCSLACEAEIVRRHKWLKAKPVEPPPPSEVPWPTGPPPSGPRDYYDPRTGSHTLPLRTGPGRNA